MGKKIVLQILLMFCTKCQNGEQLAFDHNYFAITFQNLVEIYYRYTV